MTDRYYTTEYLRFRNNEATTDFCRSNCYTSCDVKCDLVPQKDYSRVIVSEIDEIVTRLNNLEARVIAIRPTVENRSTLVEVMEILHDVKNKFN